MATNLGSDTLLAAKEAKAQAEREANLSHRVDLRSGYFRFFIRRFLASIVALIVIAVVIMAAVVGYFNGRAIKNDQLTTALEDTLQQALGPKFKVRLGETALKMSGLDLLALVSENAQVFERSSGKLMISVSKISSKLNPLQLLAGKYHVAELGLNDVTVDRNILGNAKFDINDWLSEPGINLVAQGLSRFQSIIERHELKRASITKLAFKDSLGGVVPFGLEKLTIKRKDGQTLIADVAIGHQDKLQRVNATLYSLENSHLVDARIGEIEIYKRFNNRDLKKPPWAIKAKFDLTLKFPFTDQGEAGDLELNIASRKTVFQMGKHGALPAENLNADLIFSGGANKVMIAALALRSSGLSGEFSGAVEPANPKQGWNGPLFIALSSDRLIPGLEGEKGQVITAAANIFGEFDAQKKSFNLNQWQLQTTGGVLTGAGTVGFDRETPSLAMNASLKSIPVNILEKFWPIFIAKPVRSWVLKNVGGGLIDSATMHAAIPGGVLGRFREGKRIKPDQFELVATVSDTQFNSFGALPPVKNAYGQIRIKGMRTRINLEKGSVFSKAGRLKLDRGQFEIADGGKFPIRAKLTVSARGSIHKFATLANAKPLRVMDKINMRPDQWKGFAKTEISARFPLKKGVKSHEVAWVAKLNLTDGLSSRKVAGRTIKDADVVIMANNEKATITGKATIDGIRGEVDMVEPVGKHSKVKRNRRLKTVMSEQDRLKIGLNLAPVVRGVVAVDMVQNSDGRADITADLGQATVALPWIGWKKGKGIPATARLKMALGKTQTKITDLVIKGSSFRMEGGIVFDKKGIVSARANDLVLEEGDSLSAEIQRNKNKFSISINGSSFDGRGLITKLFHQDGVVEEQGSASFDLYADIKSVRGFANHSVKNVVLQYKVVDGWLDLLRIDARFSQGNAILLDAKTSGKTTFFNIRTQNAGKSLAFLDLYSHMRGGLLQSRLTRKRGEPFRGDVKVEQFNIVDEPMLAKLVSNIDRNLQERGQAASFSKKKISGNNVRFVQAKAKIVKRTNALEADGSISGTNIGLTYKGVVFDARDRMDLRGTFMPAFGISRVVSAIPIVGQILSNGRDSGLLGITYRIRGPRSGPKLEVNPLSVVAPGVFKEVFQFK